MNTTVAALKHNRQALAAQLAAKDAELAALRSSNAYTLASAADRKRAERGLLEERTKLAGDYLHTQRGLVAGARSAWLAATPAAIQRKAALENPTRAVAVAELARLAGPQEAGKLAGLLVALKDAPGGYGLRMALAASPDGVHSEAVATALGAGTDESQDALKAYLGAKREMARTVGLAETAERALEAAHDAQMVAEEDGSSTFFSEEAIEALIGAPGA